ncbi:MAG: hypothetical protein HY720_22920 [Planctomycetes bacterium]|nr:hypothetical protein [Planctomycetota bacterium]
MTKTPMAAWRALERLRNRPDLVRRRAGGRPARGPAETTGGGWAADGGETVGEGKTTGGGRATGGGKTAASGKATGGGKTAGGGKATGGGGNCCTGKTGGTRPALAGMDATVIGDRTATTNSALQYGQQTFFPTALSGTERFAPQ